jgi:hypothetical protein
MSEYQEEVLTNIIDLQAELRGDEPDPAAKPAKKAMSTGPSEGRAADPGDLAVSEAGVTVSLSSRRSAAQAVADRIAAMNDRLDRLEFDLGNVTKRIERIEPATEEQPLDAADGDADAPWRSFLDLQKIVADRLDQR